MILLTLALVRFIIPTRRTFKSMKNHLSQYNFEVIQHPLAGDVIIS